MELMNCPSLAVPDDVMQHVVQVESSFNPYAIGVVGGKLARQPRSLAEALATVRMLEGRGFNFSVGLAQVNRHNLARYGLESYERAFETCPNLQAGSRILAECYRRSGGDWGKSFSCYYSGNFVTGYRHGYVQKIYASMRSVTGPGNEVAPIRLLPKPASKTTASAPLRQSTPGFVDPLIAERTRDTASTPSDVPKSLSSRVPFAAAGERIASASPEHEVGPPPDASTPATHVTAEDRAFVF